MRSKEKDDELIAERRRKIQEIGFQLFSQRGIESVTMPEIASASGVGRATLYRYYATKLELVVAIGIQKWTEFADEIEQSMWNNGERTAAGCLESFLECFIELYRNHRDLLRFNQFFNVFVRTENASEKQIESYNRMIAGIAERFGSKPCVTRWDGTLRTDMHWEAIFSSILHIMLAVVTRYAVGLVYTPENGADPESELLMLKRLLVQEFTR